MARFIVMALLFIQVATADPLTTFEFELPPELIQRGGTPPVCEYAGLNIPDNAVVYAAGSYSGRRIGFQIDQSGHEATQFDVAVNSRTKPVLLILGAYEPTIWNIGWSEGTEISAVFLTGYHRQVVAGLDSKVPVLNSTHHNRGPCGYLYLSKKGNKSLNPMSRKLFGKPVELVFLGDKAGRIVVGEPLAGTQQLVTSTRITPDSFRDDTMPLAGQAGLDAAVAKGILRRATAEDATRWVDELVASMPPEDVPPIAGVGIPRPKPPSLRKAYVVLKAFTYPAGLYGGNSATFFIERGVPKPKGKPGHSAVYDFNTLKCHGALCRH